MDKYNELMAVQMDHELHRVAAKIAGADERVPLLDRLIARAKREVSDYLWSHIEVATELAAQKGGGR